jgi:hypothetical protein
MLLHLRGVVVSDTAKGRVNLSGDFTEDDRKGTIDEMSKA